MSIVLTDDTYYQDIANAIRSKNGTTTQYKPSEMAAAINAISTGGGLYISGQSCLVNLYRSKTSPALAGTVYSVPTYFTFNSIKVTNQYSTYYGQYEQQASLNLYVVTDNARYLIVEYDNKSVYILRRSYSTNLYFAIYNFINPFTQEYITPTNTSDIVPYYGPSLYYILNNSDMKYTFNGDTIYPGPLSKSNSDLIELSNNDNTIRFLFWYSGSDFGIQFSKYATDPTDFSAFNNLTFTVPKIFQLFSVVKESDVPLSKSLCINESSARYQSYYIPT